MQKEMYGCMEHVWTGKILEQLAPNVAHIFLETRGGVRCNFFFQQPQYKVALGCLMHEFRFGSRNSNVYFFVCII